ncbi:MAG: hypothetical protein ACLPUO_20290 [Streptosporangiaceae bacterium]
MSNLDAAHFDEWYAFMEASRRPDEISNAAGSWRPRPPCAERAYEGG